MNAIGDSPLMQNEAVAAEIPAHLLAALTIDGINAALDAGQVARDAAFALREERAGQLESQDCGRCGGSGRYSFCQSYGDKCFDCGGKGRVLTKRGTLAAAYRATLRSKATRDLTTGDKVWNDGVPGYIAGKWDLVAGVDVIGDKARIVYPDYAGSWQGSADAHRVSWSVAKLNETHARALVYQAALILTKAGKVAKRAPKIAA